MAVNQFWSRTGPSPVEPLVGSDLQVLFVHTVNIQQQTDDVLTDDAGAPIPDWATTYTGVPCSIEPLSYEEVLDWNQRSIKASHRCWMPPTTPEGSLVTVSNRCRLAFGLRADNSVRYLSVVWAQDVAEAGVLLEILLYEAFPGGR